MAYKLIWYEEFGGRTCEGFVHSGTVEMGVEKLQNYFKTTSDKKTQEISDFGITVVELFNNTAQAQD